VNIGDLALRGLRLSLGFVRLGLRGVDWRISSKELEAKLGICKA